MPIKTGAQRPKVSKNLRSTKSKRFPGNPEGEANYAAKLRKRAERKIKKRRRKGG